MKQTILSCFIAAIATICGLFFIDVDSAIYSWNNDPPLICKGFPNQINQVIPEDHTFYAKYRITGSPWSNVCNFRIPISSEKYELIVIAELPDGKFRVSTSKYVSPPDDDGFWRDKKNAKDEVMTISEANKYIDRKFFPNPNTRRKEKKAILNQIRKVLSRDELQKG